MTPLALLRLTVTFLCLITVARSADARATQFRAGAATSNITPDLGSGIVGGFLPFPATHVHDELQARCLVLDDGNTMLAFVVCDLLGMHRSVSVEARRQIQEATGIPPERVLISCTHTHSAASALGKDRYTSEQPLDDYQRFIARRISDGVRRAVGNLRPAQIGFGTAEAPEHVFNRRWFMREGTVPVNPFGKVDKVKMNPPGGSKDLTEPAGPTDPTVSFIALREPGGKLISVFSAYSLHYVGGVGNGHISADYYGMYCETLKKLLHAEDNDPPFVALMANGTSGDVNNNNFRTPRPAKPAYGQMHFVADDVADKVNTALANITWKDHADLGARYHEAHLSWRKIEPELLAWSKEKLAGPAPGPTKADLSYIYAGRVDKLSQATDPALAPLQVFRIGDIGIGTSPCETFAEMGLDFKKRSPFAHSFMVELNHAYMGYLPTPRHFELGGYETWPGTNSLEPQASVKLLDALLEIAADLAPKAK
ncbi:MAG: neutral/alkaline non-lysosomal ceramidase N-terminal domain-containing protein [Chthoniobacteraceae bacterium]